MKRARVEESDRVLRSSAVAKCDDLAEDIDIINKNLRGVVDHIEAIEVQLGEDEPLALRLGVLEDIVAEIRDGDEENLSLAERLEALESADYFTLLNKQTLLSLDMLKRFEVEHDKLMRLYESFKALTKLVDTQQEEITMLQNGSKNLKTC